MKPRRFRRGGCHHDHEDDLWTSQFTLIELLMVAYREGRDTESVLANTTALLEVRGDEQPVLAAATYVEDHGFRAYDTLEEYDRLDSLRADLKELASEVGPERRTHVEDAIADAEFFLRSDEARFLGALSQLAERARDSSRGE